MEQIEYQEQLRELAQWISKSWRTVFFGGTGVSTESGILDLRSADRLYARKRRYPPEQTVGHSSFLAHTEQLYDFYKERMLYPDAEPNTAHLVFAASERQGKLNAVITQNIDGLYEKAGSKRVLPLHGVALKSHCLRCEKFYSLAELLSRPGIMSHRDYDGIIEPDVVLYEETLDSVLFIEAARRIAEADLLIVGGTSFVVYPAAELLCYFGGRRLAIINRSVTPADRDADLVIQAPTGEVLSKALEEARRSAISTVFALAKQLKIR